MHGQNQFGVSSNTASGTGSACLSAYVPYQLRTGLRFGFGFGALCWASAKNWQRFGVDAAAAAAAASAAHEVDVDVPLPMTSQPAKTREFSCCCCCCWYGNRLQLLLQNCTKQIKNNLIEFYFEFGFLAADLSVHKIRFSTYFPCHFRVNLFLMRLHALPSVILRQKRNWHNKFLFVKKCQRSRESRIEKRKAVRRASFKCTNTAT